MEQHAIETFTACCRLTRRKYFAHPLWRERSSKLQNCIQISIRVRTLVKTVILWVNLQWMINVTRGKQNSWEHYTRRTHRDTSMFTLRNPQSIIVLTKALTKVTKYMHEVGRGSIYHIRVSDLIEKNFSLVCPLMAVEQLKSFRLLADPPATTLARTSHSG